MEERDAPDHLAQAFLRERAAQRDVGVDIEVAQDLVDRDSSRLGTGCACIQFT
jgi:hypothetical protein